MQLHPKTDGEPRRATGPERLARTRRALPDALSYAYRRGHVQLAESGPDNIFSFTIVETELVAFIRVRYMARIRATPDEIAAEFRESLQRLRAIVENSAISRELWIRSKHGTFRFFRLTERGLVEINEHGQPLPV